MYPNDQQKNGVKDKEMERVTKAMLEERVSKVNSLLKTYGIPKIYQIGYRAGNCYLNQQSDSYESNHGIVGDSTCGTKKEIYKHMYVIIKALW